jgi:hypothetical protein
MSTTRKLAVVVSLILLVGLIYFVKNETTTASPAEPQIIPEGLQSGDIIFRRGPSIESGVVMTMDHANFSHAGIVLRRHDEIFVIHVVTGEDGPDVTKIESIHDYLRSDRATAAIAYRIVDENPSLVAHAVAAAGEFAERQVPFDSDFDLTSDRALYCTELVWRAYQKAGLDLIDEPLEQPTTSFVKSPVLWPSVLLRSKRLKPVWEWNP